jgi:hypothetical protein
MVVERKASMAGGGGIVSIKRIQQAQLFEQ